jgi:hypothetical protein
VSKVAFPGQKHCFDFGGAGGIHASLVREVSPGAAIGSRSDII